MHTPTFRRSTLLAFPLGHPSRPTPGLVNAIHLLGTHLSQPEALHSQESPLLSRAVQSIAVDSFGAHPNKLIHTLQAHVLLAYYFLRTGSLLEAKCRSGTAVSLALGAGLHKIRSTNMTAPSTLSLIQDQPYMLPPPADTLQEAERINGFWTVLTLHKFITVALESPSQVCGALEAPGMQIDTPWPVDMDVFEEVQVPLILQHIAHLYKHTQSGNPSVGSQRQLDSSRFFEWLSWRSRHMHDIDHEGSYSLPSCCAFNRSMVT